MSMEHGAWSIERGARSQLRPVPLAQGIEEEEENS